MKKNLLYAVEIAKCNIKAAVAVSAA